MRQFQMFQKTVELHAIQATPGAMKVLSSLSLLPRIVVVQKLVHYPGWLFSMNGSKRIHNKVGKYFYKKIDIKKQKKQI